MKTDSPLALRMKEIVSDQADSVYDFAQSIGDQRSEKVNRVLRSLGAPSFDMLERIKATYPSLNLNWLVSGEGKKYQDLSKSSELEPIASIDLEETLPSLKTSRIPFVQSKNRDTYLQNLGRSSVLESFPSLDAEYYEDGEYADFEVDVDEMEPTLNMHDVVRARRANPEDVLKAFAGKDPRIPFFNKENFGAHPLILIVHKPFFGFLLRRLVDMDDQGYLILEGDSEDSQRLRIKPAKAELWLISEIRKRK